MTPTPSVQDNPVLKRIIAHDRGDVLTRIFSHEPDIFTRQYEIYPLATYAACSGKPSTLRVMLNLTPGFNIEQLNNLLFFILSTFAGLSTNEDEIRARLETAGVLLDAGAAIAHWAYMFDLPMFWPEHYGGWDRRVWSSKDAGFNRLIRFLAVRVGPSAVAYFENYIYCRRKMDRNFMRDVMKDDGEYFDRDPSSYILPNGELEWP